METIDLSNVTAEQLEEALKSKKKRAKVKREKERKEYEGNRDLRVNSIITRAKQLSNLLESFKADCHQIMDEQFESLKGYGAIRSNSKGGFSVVHSCGDIKVVRTRSTQPHWDERSKKAVELINSFLHDTIKKKDVDTFELLLSFIQKNDNGDLEYSRVMILLGHQDRYDDPRWVEGLKLIRESYSVHLTGYGYDFKIKDEKGKWKNINIQFSSI